MPRLLLLCLLLACTWPAQALRLAVLSEAGFPHNALGDAKALSAPALGQYLDRFGDVSVLNYDEASRPDLLSPDLFDVFVVPYGGNYPLYLLPNLLHFCERGGDLILAEGAPFSVPYEVRGGAWMPVTVSRHDMGGMYYEAMRLLDFRDFGLFAYRVPPQLRLLEYGEELVSESYDGYLVGAHTSDRLHQDTQVARNFSLLTVRDKYGEVSGSAATLVRHFAGQFQDSTWVILGGYGKTSPLHPAFKHRDQFWAETLNCLGYPAFAPAAFDLPSYLPSERASCQLKVRSSATTYVEAQLRLSLRAEDGTELSSSLVTGVGNQALRLAPRATATFAASFTVPDLTNQFITLTATLSELSGRELDTFEVACWVLGETPKGPELSITSPFFELDKRPRQVFGINYSGPVDGAHLGLAGFNLVYFKNDLEHFSKAGVKAISLFSQRYDAGRSTDDLRNLRLDLARMAAAKREGLLVKFITLDKQVIWSGEGYQSWLLDNSFLTRQGDVLAGYASQWQNVLFDITSEAPLAQNDSALLRGSFQDWLADHYTNPAEALDRWGKTQEPSPTSFAAMPVPDLATALMGDNWKLDLGTVLSLLPEKPVPAEKDYFSFSASVWDRFYGRLRSALGPAGKGHYITGLSMAGDNRALPWQTAASIDVPNSHLYEQLLGLAGSLALYDFRYINKPFFAGELGYYDSSYLPPEYQLTSFSEQQRGYYEEAVARALMRQTAGLLFWELHDGRNEWQIEKGVESDYGLVSKADEVPKAGFWAVRNANLLAALTTPTEQPPQAVLVLPVELIDSSYRPLALHRLRATANCLMAAGLDFWTVPSTALASIPAEAKLVLCPLIWGLSDGEWATLRQLAESGKLVYLSGDVLRDEYLLARRPDRLADLKLGSRAPLFTELRGLLTSAPVEVTPTDEFGSTSEAKPTWLGHPLLELAPRREGKVLARTASGSPTLVELTLGAGSLVYAADPLEFYVALDDGGTINTYAEPVTWLYRQLALRAGLELTAATPAPWGLHLANLKFEEGPGLAAVYSKRQANSWELYSLPSDAPERFQLTLAGRSCEADIRPGSTAVALFLEHGGPWLLQVDGHFADPVGGDRVDTRSGSALFLVGLDHQPLSSSTELLIVPRLVQGKEKLSLRRSPNAPRLEANIVELADGKAKLLESLSLRQSGTGFELELSSDETHQLILLTEKGRGAEVAAKLAALLAD